MGCWVSSYSCNQFEGIRECAYTGMRIYLHAYMRVCVHAWVCKCQNSGGGGLLYPSKESRVDRLRTVCVGGGGLFLKIYTGSVLQWCHSNLTVRFLRFVSKLQKNTDSEDTAQMASVEQRSSTKFLQNAFLCGRVFLYASSSLLVMPERFQRKAPTGAHSVQTQSVSVAQLHNAHTHTHTHTPGAASSLTQQPVRIASATIPSQLATACYLL